VNFKDWFTKFAERTAKVTGSPYACGASMGVVLVWASLGPVFKYSQTWQLFINTTTTIVTFLMCFLIQAAQNKLQADQARDTKAIQLKLDTVIKAQENIDDEMIKIEDLPEEELDKLKEKE
jgi:low affinity Fe/Cu permease